MAKGALFHLRRVACVLAVCLGLLLVVRGDAAMAGDKAAPPSEASLISAWEAIQQNDPKTTVFEKTGEGHYHFATERFPYDGNLNVLNVTIEALPGSVMGESYYGVIEVELTDLTADFYRKYSYSYSAWQKNNYLYYNAADKTWSTTTQWSATLAEEYDTPHGMMQYSTIFWLGALVVLLLVAVLGLRQVRTAMAQQKTALDGQAKALEMMQHSQEMAAENLKVQKENAKLLKRILEALEK